MSDHERSASSSQGNGDPPRLKASTQWERYGRYPYLLAKVIFYGILFYLLYWVLNSVSAVAFPIFISLLIAYILNPSVKRLNEWGVPRTLGIGILIVGVGLFFTVFGWFLYPTMADQVQKIGERAPQVVEVVEERTFPWLASTFGVELPSTWTEMLEDYSEEIRNAIPSVAQYVGEWATEAVDRTRIVLVSLFNLILIPIFTFYFLRDFEKGKRIMERFVPQWKREIIYDRARQMDMAVSQWFRGQLEVSLILAVLYAISLGLVYGLTGHGAQSGVVIGLLTGFLNVIPYLGFAIGSVLAFIVVLVDWTGWAAIIGVAVSFAVIQTVESYYITPTVMGEKVGLKTITVIIVLVIGGSVGGILGVILAIPITAMIKVMLPDIIAWYQHSSIYTGQEVEPATSDYLIFRRREYQDGRQMELNFGEMGSERRQTEEEAGPQKGDEESVEGGTEDEREEEAGTDQQKMAEQQGDQEGDPSAEEPQETPEEDGDDRRDGDEDPKPPVDT